MADHYNLWQAGGVPNMSLASLINGYHQSRYFVDAAAGARTLALPDAAGFALHHICTLYKSDASANAVTIEGSGGQTIGGSATYTLAQQYDRVCLRSDGANWGILDTSGSHENGSSIPRWP